MKLRLQIIGTSLIATFALMNCSHLSKNQKEKPQTNISQSFKDYWYAGKAEINSYTLKQSRYGEDRDGNAALIFVTEDFSIHKQVKLDNPETDRKDKVSVLKMNFTKNFVTGIYPYSMMLSAFTPIDQNQISNTLKLTMSVQEWCGQVYSQANLKNNGYSIVGHSYFEKEADQTLYLKAVWLEDELWNRIRLDPETLPMGEIEIIPGLFFSRLNHTGLDVEKAICSKVTADNVITYSILFSQHQRSLAIQFEKEFPHRINGWIEQSKQGDKTITTSATLDKQLYTDYWTKNKNEFQNLRDSLGLSRKNY
jgi:hypothetical protein